MIFIFFFFKQKTAYEMRISDWSSDVCSSDLAHRVDREVLGRLHARAVVLHFGAVLDAELLQHPAHDAAAGLGVGVEDEFVAVVGHARSSGWKDRKSVV